MQNITWGIIKMKNKFDLKCPECENILEMITDGFSTNYDKYNDNKPSAITLAVCRNCYKKMRISIPLQLSDIKYIVKDM